MWLCPPGEETASKHWWECRGGWCVGRGQRRRDGGRLQADEWRCMYMHWHCPTSSVLSTADWLSVWVYQLECELLLYFLFLFYETSWLRVLRLRLSCLVFVVLCFSCLSSVLLFLFVTIFFFVWLVVLIFLLFSLLLCPFFSSMSLASFKVEGIVLNHVRHPTQSCAMILHPACDVWTSHQVIGTLHLFNAPSETLEEVSFQPLHIDHCFILT